MAPTRRRADAPTRRCADAPTRRRGAGGARAASCYAHGRVKRSLFVVLPLLLLAWFGFEHGFAVPPTAAPASTAKPAAGTAPRGGVTRAPKPAPAASPTASSQARYIAIGGGSVPEFTEVSLEQDMLLAEQVLPGPGVLLFAGGNEAASVRSLDPRADPDAVLARLGNLFLPRAGRQSQYRRPSLSAAAATLDNVERALGRAFGESRERLLVYVAAHGEQGEHARDNYVDLWGRERLLVSRVAELHEAQPQPRPLRLLVASCFSGGFGELAFAGAEVEKGITRAPRCGLFAGPWDRQTSGCDPNPDRGAQEGYSIHVLHALLRQDRNGQPLPAAELDYDGDGSIGLLEAHTRARIASASIDVPTTTSERYLREVEQKHGPIDLTLLPEDAAVVAQLGKKLGAPSRARAEQRLKELRAKLIGIDERFEDADAARETAVAKLSAELLGRWPVVDDPYHAEFASTLQKHGGDIAEVLDRSAAARELRKAEEQIEALDLQLRALEPQEAMLMRLLRAYETLALASSLASRGGPKYQNYRALLACERERL